MLESRFHGLDFDVKPSASAPSVPTLDIDLA
jgi:hypothetical protein